MVCNADSALVLRLNTGFHPFVLVLLRVESPTDAPLGAAPGETTSFAWGLVGELLH